MLCIKPTRCARYKELDGFLLIHNLLPSPPPRTRAAVVQVKDTLSFFTHTRTLSHPPTQMHEPLSICDDDFFFILVVFDHAIMSVAPYFLPMMIDLPPFFAVAVYATHTLHFWASASRVSSMHFNTCSNHTTAAAAASVTRQWHPLGHMMHLVMCVSYVFTRLFVFSRHRELHKQRLLLLLRTVLSSSIVHLLSALRLPDPPPPPRPSTFRSRPELLQPQPVELPPLLLPADGGVGT